jgi:hypothetical protein
MDIKIEVYYQLRCVQYRRGCWEDNYIRYLCKPHGRCKPNTLLQNPTAVVCYIKFDWVLVMIMNCKW